MQSRFRYNKAAGLCSHCGDSMRRITIAQSRVLSTLRSRQRENFLLRLHLFRPKARFEFSTASIWKLQYGPRDHKVHKSGNDKQKEDHRNSQIVIWQDYIYITPVRHQLSNGGCNQKSSTHENFKEITTKQSLLAKQSILYRLSCLLWWDIRGLVVGGVGTAFREACGGSGLDRSSLGYPLSSLVDFYIGPWNTVSQISFWKLCIPYFIKMIRVLGRELASGYETQFDEPLPEPWQNATYLVLGRVMNYTAGSVRWKPLGSKQSWLSSIFACRLLKLDHGQPSFSSIFPEARHRSGIPCFINMIRVLGRELVIWQWNTVWQTSPSIVNKGNLFRHTKDFNGNRGRISVFLLQNMLGPGEI